MAGDPTAFVEADLDLHAFVAGVARSPLHAALERMAGVGLRTDITGRAQRLARDEELDELHRRLVDAIDTSDAEAARATARAIAIAGGAAPDSASGCATLSSVPQIHLLAEPGDYAPLVLLPGDPNRARKIAERFDGGLGKARQVTEHRALYGWTGTYQGHPVSVQTSGMGTPSFAIVAEELLRLGAKQLIRVGTCGGIAPGLRTGDLVVALSACPTDGATSTYLHGDRYAPTADFALTHTLVHAAEEAGIPVRIGPVASVDVFYNTDADYFSKWRERGVLAFEMEASVLFYLAARAGIQAACLLTVSDVLNEGEGTEETYMSLEDLDAAVERMIEVALTAAVQSGP